jgi:RNA polymerase sigma-70 factor (ECF subfamily)
MVDWKLIVSEHGPAVWRTAYRLLADRADADDCFQETFADALSYTRRDKGPVRHWPAFLVRLATARAIDRLRQRVRRSGREQPTDDMGRHADPARQSDPPTRAQDAEHVARLRTVLAHLPPKQADAFCLHCLEGWSYREVADSLGTSTDHVGMLISRARATLRDRLAAVLSAEALTDLHAHRASLPVTEGEVLS